VSGTFTVPWLGSDDTCQTAESQWVGIGGVTDQALVQAGVQESPIDSQGGCAAPDFYITVWWEVLPNPQQRIPLTVNAGDKVTVDIYSLGPQTAQWEIYVQDVTSGQSYWVQPDFQYGGGSSAEWVNEAVTGTSCGGVCSMTSYSPPVTFSGLSYRVDGYQAQMTGHVNAIDQLTMVQNGQDVSVPSPITGMSGLMSGGFTTSP
jgi:hypothetical protein